MGRPAAESPTTTPAETCNYEAGSRQCAECERLLPASRFSRNRARRDGLNRACKDCSLEGVRRSRGVTGPLVGARPGPDERCAICGGSGGRRGLYLDHDHLSGHVRGWLCVSCNSILGHAGDSPEILDKAIRYLRMDDES